MRSFMLAPKEHPEISDTNLELFMGWDLKSTKHNEAHHSMFVAMPQMYAAGCDAKLSNIFFLL